jgi:hypothetical protein
MTSSNIDMLSKQMNKLENYVTKYIYKKYIEIETSSSTNNINTTDTISTIDKSDTIDTPDTTDDELEEELTYIYSKKPKNLIDYKLYKDRVFGKDRQSIIKQEDQLKDDLKKMKQADIAYNKKPLLFKKCKTNSYPDSKRCTYIRNYKNKLSRCKNNIINDNEDICFKHEDSPNIYWDSYIELLEKLNKTK